MDLIESSLKDLLGVLNNSNREGAKLKVESGLLYSEGCEGQPGGCCAKMCDLSDVIQALRDLIGVKSD